jgi:DNA (cytosine-5)-methyltransferase 1
LKGKDLEHRIDIITGGFPCQDISVAGHGAGLAGERSGLFFEIVRLACELSTHATSSWRTCQQSLGEAEPPLLQNLPKSGMSVDGQLYPLKPLEQIIGASGGGYWHGDLIPTPLASDGERGHITPYQRNAKSQSKRTLCSYLKTYPMGSNGQPNPSYIDWVMGYPIGYSELKPLETA